MKLPCIHVSIVCIRGFRSKEVFHGGSYAKYLKILYFPSDSFLFNSLDQNSPTSATRHNKVIVSLKAVILKNQSQKKRKLLRQQDFCRFMMVLVLFRLIFLNKTKSTSCRDLSPNRPFQELNNITI